MYVTTSWPCLFHSYGNSRILRRESVHFTGGKIIFSRPKSAETELSGGSITNVVRRCALQLLMSGKKTLDVQTLKEILPACFPHKKA